MSNVNNFLNSYKEIIYLIFLSFIFAITAQSFELFKGNANYLIYAIKEFDDNKLQMIGLLTKLTTYHYLHTLITY